MAAVTQTIPSYNFGVSQQSDPNMAPGFLSDIKNGYPDAVFGLQKRPGAKYDNVLLDSSSNPVAATALAGAYWFSIIKDSQTSIENEQDSYFGCIVPAVYSGSTLTTLGNVRIWNAKTGVEMTVNFDPSTGPGGLTAPYTNTVRDYFTSASSNDYKVVTIDKSSSVLNRSITVTQSATNTPGSISTEVTTFADLPTSPSTNDIVKILNSDGEKDDYYLKWNGSAWVEVAKPGISDGFNNWTAPHTIKYVSSSNTFVVREAQYTNRTAGDETTVPTPSFVGAKIQDVFFYLNRVGFLSNDNVILSSTLIPDYVSTSLQDISFFSKSSQISIASDPIDLNTASVRAVTLYSVQPSRAGLVLFGNGEQFFMFSGDGLLTPQTAEIKSVSTYEVDTTIPVIELGDEIYFVSKTPRYTRVFKMMNRGTEAVPIVTEVSKIVQEYVPSNIDKVVSNTQNQLLGLTSKSESNIWLYRQFYNEGEKILQSWFRWELIGKILTFAFFTDTMFSVLELTNGNVAIVRQALNKDPDGDLLTSVITPNPVAGTVFGVGPNIDLWTEVTGTPTYDKPTNKTTIPLPTNYPALANTSSITYKPVMVLSEKTSQGGTTISTQAGDYKDATVSGNNFVVDGDYTSVANKMIVGYKYDMELKLPTTYFRDQNGAADFTASLVLSRYKFFFAPTGRVTFKVDGYSSYEAGYSVLNPQTYPSNTLPVFDEVTFDVPLHMRNELFNLSIISDTPFPSALISMRWEGNYNPRYYRRS